MMVIVAVAPMRVTMMPASGSEITEPTAIESSTRPRLPGSRASACLTWGMRAAQLANAKPEALKAT